MAEPFLGEVRLFAGNFAPVGWHFCDGTILEISQNEALYSLIGTSYGGDGQTTFGLPDLRGRIPVHVSGALPLGQPGGSESVPLVAANLPAHTHTLGVVTEDGKLTTPEKNTLAQSDAIKLYSTVYPAVALGGSSITASAGGCQPHNNVQQYLCLNYIIAVEGIYPPQN